jgi:hypothetical protein
MFLGLLNEREKKAYIFFAAKLIYANDALAIERENVLGFLTHQMDSPESVPLNITEDEAYSVLLEADNAKKRMIYTSLLILTFSGNSGDNENDILKDIRNRLGLPDSFTTEAIRWKNSFWENMNELFRLIEGKVQ